MLLLQIVEGKTRLEQQPDHFIMHTVISAGFNLDASVAYCRGQSSSRSTVSCTLSYQLASILTVLLQIVEGETRLKQQQNLYEAVRADRNLYSKNLIQAQDEIQEMKRKFQIMVRIHARHTAHF